MIGMGSRSKSLNGFYKTLATKVVSSLTATFVVWAMKSFISLI